ncbi:hypothetical protein FJ250_02690 [bacterium]|nr:hypothetical protein [bacterium]
MRHRIAAATLAAALLLAGQAWAVVEAKTGTEYPDTITVVTAAGDQALTATGAALREKTMLKVDVYTIASWVAAGAELGEDRAAAIWTLDAPKRLRLDLRRSFSRAKLIGAFREVIERNYPDRTAIAEDLATFEGYFTRDAQSGDVILFTYLPGDGVTTELNGEARGVIPNPKFVEALWSVWFGPQPVDGGMKKALAGKAR